jgi:hypothetical protein
MVVIVMVVIMFAVVMTSVVALVWPPSLVAMSDAQRPRRILGRSLRARSRPWAVLCQRQAGRGHSDGYNENGGKAFRLDDADGGHCESFSIFWNDLHGLIYV